MIETWTLVALLVGSNIYWASVCFKLTNRLMSRNYFEFKQSERKPAKQRPEIVSDELDQYAENQAQSANSFMGIA